MHMFSTQGMVPSVSLLSNKDFHSKVKAKSFDIFVFVLLSCGVLSPCVLSPVKDCEGKYVTACSAKL